MAGLRFVWISRRKWLQYPAFSQHPPVLGHCLRSMSLTEGNKESTVEADGRRLFLDAPERAHSNAKGFKTLLFFS